MRKLCWAMLAEIVVLGVLMACGGRRHHGPGPTGGGVTPTPTVTPGTSGRMSRQELQQRQRFAAQNTAIPPAYTSTRKAAAVARGQAPSLDGIDAGTYWTNAYAAFCYYNGDAATKDAAKSYFREWLRNEQDPNMRISSMMCSLNHQQVRSTGIYFATQILGKTEALKYGDRSKVERAKEMVLDILNGAAWYGTYGSREATGPCSGGGKTAGEHPEGYRSRHYAVRFWMYTWALADMAEPDVAKVARTELDKALANMRPGVGPTGIWDETILPHYRHTHKGSPTGARCPPNCPSGQKKYKLTCGPGETASLSYLFFSWVQWCPEFAGKTSPCDEDEDADMHWGDYIYVGGAGWTPEVK